MAYMNDPRENRFGPNGQVWENDNRVEERYYWNGAFVDLCDLPPADYAKTIFHTEGSGGGGGDIPGGKSKNTITLVETKGDGFVTFQLKAEKPVESEINSLITVNTTAGPQKQTLTISKGEKLSNILTVNYSQEELIPRTEAMETIPKTDTKFIYNENKPEVLPSLYSINLTTGSLPKKEDVEGNNNLLKNSRKITVDMNSPKESVGFSTNIQKADIPGFAEMTNEEKDAALAKAVSDIIFITDREVDDIRSTDKALPSDKDQWRMDRDIVENGSGITYHVWVRESPDQVCSPDDEPKNWDIIVIYK